MSVLAHATVGWITLEALRRCYPAAIDALHRLVGLQLSAGVLILESSALNSSIYWLGEASRNRSDRKSKTLDFLAYLDVFYVIGAVVFALLQCGLLILLVLGACSMLFRILASDLSSESISNASEEAVLRPQLPGYNMPVADAPLVGGALLLTLAFHELGHGIAASTERVKTEGVGIFLAYVIPGAFVRLEEGLLPQLPTRAQLKVYCAGAWHNLILAVLCVIATSSIPYALFPFYQRSISGLALDLPRDSPFYDRAGRPNEALLALDDIRMLSPRSMTRSIKLISERSSLATPLVHFGINDPGTTTKDEFVQISGICVNREELQQASSPFPSSNSQCFVLDLGFHQYSSFCVRSSLLIEEARRVAHTVSSNLNSPTAISCENTHDCVLQGQTSSSNPSLLHCAKPIVEPGESFVIVHLASGTSLAWRGDVLRDGLGPALRLAPLAVRPSIAAWSMWLGGRALLYFLVRFPARLLFFVKTLRDVSVSIALLNILPIYWLDGSLAAVQFIRLFLLSAMPKPSMATKKAEVFKRSRDYYEPEDNDIAQVLREQYHDWNAIHIRQKRLTRILLGGGTALVVFNVFFGSLFVVMH